MDSNSLKTDWADIDREKVEHNMRLVHQEMEFTAGSIETTQDIRRIYDAVVDDFLGMHIEYEGLNVVDFENPFPVKKE